MPQENQSKMQLDQFTLTSVISDRDSEASSLFSFEQHLSNIDSTESEKLSSMQRQHNDDTPGSYGGLKNLESLDQKLTQVQNIMDDIKTNAEKS